MCARIKSRYRKSLSETIKRKITKPTNQVPKKSICVLTANLKYCSHVFCPNLKTLCSHLFIFGPNSFNMNANYMIKPFFSFLKHLTQISNCHLNSIW